MPEQRVDFLLEFAGNMMFKPLRFVMRLVQIIFQHLHQKTFEKPVAAHDCERAWRPFWSG